MSELVSERKRFGSRLDLNEDEESSPNTTLHVTCQVFLFHTRLTYRGIFVSSSSQSQSDSATERERSQKKKKEKKEAVVQTARERFSSWDTASQAADPRHPPHQG